MAELSPPGRVALAFANAAADGDFDTAHQLLTAELQREISPAMLKLRYERMFAYVDGIAATDVELVNIDEMDGWEIKEQGDMGLAYVAIDARDQNGYSYGEAVTVIVSNRAGEPRIRWIDWGRP
jgi:hypothetical protein